MRLNFGFGDHKQDLRKERRDLYGMRAAALMMMAARQSGPEFDEYQKKFRDIETKLEQVESQLLLLEAHYLGLVYPTEKEKPVWWSSNAYQFWLSEQGRIGLNKLIKEEQREKFEWWITIVIVPLAGLLITLLSLIVAILALRNK